MIGNVWLSRLALVLLGGGWAATALAANAPDKPSDPVAVLAQSDRARGGGLPGIVWDVDVVVSGNDNATDGGRRLRVEATRISSVAETLEPVRFAGTKLLQVERNMWMTRPGLQKPIPISPRQRLTGQAANGDIAATNYAGDYAPTLLREEAIDGEPCYVLDLVAKTKRATYDHIIYWVSRERGVGVKAEFLSLSGKLLKTATFEYRNQIDYDGQSIGFISKMTIRDALTPAQTLLQYDHVTVRTVPTSEFDVSNLR